MKLSESTLVPISLVAVIVTGAYFLSGKMALIDSVQASDLQQDQQIKSLQDLGFTVSTQLSAIGAKQDELKERLDRISIYLKDLKLRR